MEQVTLGQVGVALTFIVGLLTSIGYLKKHFGDWMGTAVGKEIKPLTEKIAAMDTRLSEVDMESTKNFLVARIAEVERGDAMSEIEKQRLLEQYDHYKKAGGNSYIKIKVEQMRADGIL